MDSIAFSMGVLCTVEAKMRSRHRTAEPVTKDVFDPA